MKTLEDKIKSAIKLIQSAGKIAKEHGQPLEICYSGGKDSDVILELAHMGGVEFRAIYKNTTIDPPRTIAHARAKGVEIYKPKITFREAILKKGMPSRFRRFCCGYLKEYKVLDYAVLGIRREESNARAERYKEPEMCRVYNKNEKTRQYFPILDWTGEDIEKFIKMRQIKCHPLYYDENGQFHVERRLGCIGCPMQSKKRRIEEFTMYPRMVKFYITNAQKYLDTHPNSKINSYFNDACEWFTFALYCDNLQEFHYRFGADMFGQKIDCKKHLEEKFGIEL